MNYTNVSETFCNWPCDGNTLDYIEYCGSYNNYASVYSTGKTLKNRLFENFKYQLYSIEFRFLEFLGVSGPSG